ncbi:MAG: molybdopterin-guanine dinucleotide biosynthesis protein B [Betaproteobacteria bacterium]|nr:molybdopterin-guanine dinucleotide biosynthesis protein B [Betaproteobacteria bacterium]
MKVFGFAGYSGSGKTTLVEELIPRFVMEGLRVSVIKHAHHDFDIDKPGKDSYRHRRAGATEVMITASRRWVIMHELGNEPEPELPEQLKRLSPCDLVLVEGFKRQPIPKLEIHRKEAHKPLLFPEDKHVVAIATDEKLDTTLPQFGLEDYDAIVNFILRYFGIERAENTEKHAAAGKAG